MWKNIHYDESFKDALIIRVCARRAGLNFMSHYLQAGKERNRSPTIPISVGFGAATSNLMKMLLG